MRAHIVENNLITNTIEVAALDVLPNLVDASIGGFIGWTWNDGVPAPPVVLPVLCCDDRCDAVDDLRTSKFYTDVTATFPGGDKVIQFRNESDRNNLRDVCAGATQLIATDQGTTAMVYRTADNVVQNLTANEMAAIGMAVLAAKQAIVSKAWEHKDALTAICNNVLLTDAEKVTAMEAYDITAGW